jgi:hypothetical protein
MLTLLNKFKNRFQVHLQKIVKIGFLLCAGERAKVRENVNKKYV